MKSLWIRAETLPNECRTALTPEDAHHLITQGHNIIVESSATRIFHDRDYVAVGCRIVAAASYHQASQNDYILGIKALHQDNDAIPHRHIYFAHAYKGQEDAKSLLRRFHHGGGAIYDLEFLYDQAQRRACYFGYWSGVAAASLSLLQWCKTKLNTVHAHPTFFPSTSECFDMLEQGLSDCGQKPRVIIIGHKGNCGRGVKSVLERFGVEATCWDMEDTQARTDFVDIYQHDIFFNCIYLKERIPPFITREELATISPRKLSIVCDIACDPDNPLNPIPIYSKAGSLAEPCIRQYYDEQALDIIAVSNLPSFFPRESSTAFSAQLRPYLEQLLAEENLPRAWSDLEQLYRKHAAMTATSE